MKITKTKLNQVIKEEIMIMLNEHEGEGDSEWSNKLVDVLNTLSNRLEDLDISIDYLAAAMTGENPDTLGQRQSMLGRLYTPSSKISVQNKTEVQP